MSKFSQSYFIPIFFPSPNAQTAPARWDWSPPSGCSPPTRR